MEIAAGIMLFAFVGVLCLVGNAVAEDALKEAPIDNKQGEQTSDYIKREDVKKALQRKIPVYMLGKLFKAIDDILGADKVVETSAIWTECYVPLPLSDGSRTAFKCSKCHTTWDSGTNFCPNCGARMDDCFIARSL